MKKTQSPFVPRHLSKPDASLGIGSPHTGYEVPLMAAGKKPCLITAWPLQADIGGDYTKLQPLIESGHIIVMAIKEFEFPYHIICKPHLRKEAQKAAGIRAKRIENMPIEEHEWRWEERFIEAHCNIQLRDKDGRVLVDEFNQRVRNSGNEYKLLMDGTIAATIPVMTGENFRNTPPAIQEQLKNGTLCASFAYAYINSAAILAQKNCEDMGKELAARCWRAGESYPPLSDKEATRRVGHLLGYTPEDTEFFLTVGTQHPSKHTAEDKGKIAAYDLLRYARAQSLLKNEPKMGG